MIRHLGRLAVVTALLLPGAALAVAATVHKTPTCSCCDAYAEHLQASGFDVETIDHDSMDRIFREARVERALASCHLTRVGPYTVIGHVPASVIESLVNERPMIRGISLPGMPAGSPGMGGEKQEPFTIYRLGANTDAPDVYDRY
ncbi:DUF411 domain-containing protein [Sediminicurvatus halobius]|nr:DUF411 domain-containing protein [Spiribacter halobius]UEX79163.1 hypothetical protein LMH63_05845 [Spiribacter halobius]